MKKKGIVGEVLLILLVAGVLTFITYKQFETAKQKSRDMQRKSDLNDFAKIIKWYYADYGKLPSEELINSSWGNSFIDSGYSYADSVPKEKSGKKEYCYQIGEDGKSFRLSAELEYKKDPDCKVDGQLCNEIKYCYTDIKYVNETTK